MKRKLKPRRNNFSKRILRRWVGADAAANLEQFVMLHREFDFTTPRINHRLNMVMDQRVEAELEAAGFKNKYKAMG